MDHGDDDGGDAASADAATAGGSSAAATVDRESTATAAAATATGETRGIIRPLEWAEADAPPMVVIAIGERMGRYVIVERIGAGGMGVVYKAYDPVLDRAVAIKVLRAQGEDHAQRLLREAQALARLAHPNVLTVFEAGVDDGRTFLAIELIDGATLHGWLAATPRTRAEILTVFDAAGRGLAAAHAAGIVHRDFKPSNVLIGRDQRVRVADFGIARGTGDEAGASPHASPSARTFDSPITATGMLVGTPAYMAPEQAVGERVDPRSDQFSFCVALWEALTGKRPYSGPTPMALAARVERGELDDPRAGTGLPRRLRRALLRGLAYEPARRYPSMVELLDELPPTRRLRWGATAVAVIAIGGVVLARTQSAPAPTCAGFEAELAGVWDDGARARLAPVFAAVADADWPRTRVAIDGWSTAWVAARTDACADTRVRGGQSERAMDRRMACLDRRLLELGALTALLGRGDPATLGRATQAAIALTPPSTCDQVDLLGAAAPPASADERARVVAVERGVAELKALHDAVRHRDGLAEVDAVVTAARALPHHGLAAEALAWRGRMHRQLDAYPAALAAYTEALGEAELAGDDRIRLDILVRALDITGYFLEDVTHTAWLAANARGILARLGDPPELVSDFDESMSNAEMRFGNLVEARRLVEHMLALRRGRVDEDSPLWARTLRAYARVTQNQGELELTAQYIYPATAIMERHLGPDHPNLGYYLNVIGILERQRGQLDAAERTFRRDIEISTKAYGADNGKVGRSWNNLGGTLRDAGRPAEALEALERARVIHSTAVGPKSLLVAGTLTSMAGTLRVLGRAEEAWARGQEALAIYRAAPGNRDIAGTLTLLAEIAAIRPGPNRPAEALALVDEAIAVATGDGPDAARLIGPLITRGELHHAAGRTPAAVADLERALVLLAANPQAPDDHARAETALARAVAVPDPARARTLATAARDRLRTTGAEGAQRRSIDAWLADLDRR